MNLRLIREPSRQQTTLGVLFVDDQFFAFTLEDELRERVGQAVSLWKIAGQTAISAGRYEVKLSFSQKFQRVLPEVLDVPGFSGIRLHSGNRHTDSEGCILLGFNRANAMITDSRMAVTALIDRLAAEESANRRSYLVIENPLSYL